MINRAIYELYKAMFQRPGLYLQSKQITVAMHFMMGTKQGLEKSERENNAHLNWNHSEYPGFEFDRYLSEQLNLNSHKLQDSCATILEQCSTEEEAFEKLSNYFQTFEKSEIRKDIGWHDIKKDPAKVYPERETRVYFLQGINGKSLGWTNAAYAFYPYQNYVEHCVEINIRLDKKDQRALDFHEIEMDLVLAKGNGEKTTFEDIEHYFFNALKSNCTPLVLAINTNDTGFDLEIYVDEPEKAAEKLNQLKASKDKMFDFEFKITKDEKWNIIGMMLY